MKSTLSKLLMPRFSFARFDAAMLVYRIGIGAAMFYIHGWKKVTDFAGTVANIPDPFGMGGKTSAIISIVANIVCTALIAIGLFTRPAAAFILSVTTVGLFVVHAADPWTVKDVPLMYTLAFGLLLLLGPGRYSIDFQLFNADKKRSLRYS